MKTHHADWYDTPLYYDIVFDADTAKEADFLEAMMHLHGARVKPAPWRVLEPACGSGRLIAELAQRGYAVCGFDLNENMLEHARERLMKRKLRAELWPDRLEDFRAPGRGKFDLAHCLVSTFKYVLEEDGAVSHLKRVAASVRAGGLYVLGLHLTNYRVRRAEHERWCASRGGISVVCNTHTWPADRKSRAEQLRTRLRITRGGQTWTQETKWKFRTYDAAELQRLLDAAPEFEHVASYDFTYDLTAPRELDNSFADIVLVLRRR